MNSSAWTLPEEIEDRGRLPSAGRLPLGASNRDLDLEGLIQVGMPFAAFLTFEAQSDRRHEYIQGRVYAMAGADEAHNTVAGNIFALLRAAVRGSTCRVYQTDMALRFEDEIYVYPDVMLTCSSSDAKLEQFKREPSLLVEVLSARTANRDRGEKLERYRRIPSLRQYWLVSKDRQYVEVYERTGSDWKVYSIQDGVIRVPEVQVEIALQNIYEDVTLPSDVPGP